jgi:hypothetical protein
LGRVEPLAAGTLRAIPIDRTSVASADEDTPMAAKLRTRIARALNQALLNRDKAEMRAIDSLLSMAGPRARPRPTTVRKKPARRPR